MKHNKKSHKKGSHKGVVAKKHLGQHFLKDEKIAQRIAEVLSYKGYNHILEIGPGTGLLTKHVLRPDMKVTALELDSESVEYLKNSFPLEYPKLANKQQFEVLETDFLKKELKDIYKDQEFAIVGNFPYNISSQIVFKTLSYRNQVPEFGGMFQKEVAQRICATHGSKTYGILSVLAQAYYNSEYIFTIGPEVFNPPPKVDSGVLLLTRKKAYDQLPCTYEQLRKVVKLAFQQRRKTLRNSLKSLQLPDTIKEQQQFNLRPEQVSVDDFISLTTMLIPYLG